MEIKPGIGIGEIKFGITEDELIKLFGKPLKIIESEYIEDSGDFSRELIYQKGLSFCFDLEDNYRLGRITIESNGYKLFGQDLIGLSLEYVKSFLSKKKFEIPKREDLSSQEIPNYILLEYSNIGMFFWFKGDLLEVIQCNYLFHDDHDTIKWPE